ncbi:MAG: TIGR02444 family protein, partial [Proteobacteria bacterium]|nr:TIGR02444 family protein [Pseudomonadota bacterium]
YSLNVYRRDGVSPALINFQDRHNLDVNILLLCLWMGYSGRGELDDADFSHVLRVSANWNPEIVCAIRDVRIRLRQEIALVPKELSDAVRKKLLELEIECEHVEQLSLATGLTQKEPHGGSSEEKLRDCGLNLKSYFDRKGCILDADDRRELLAILWAAFDDLNADKIRPFCEEIFA